MSSIDPAEIEKFSRMADTWWDPTGPFKPLHQLNPLRLAYVRDKTCAHFGRDALTPDPLAGLRMLDLGCGGGLLSEPLARMGAEMLGVDAAEKNVTAARIHADRVGVGVDYRHGSAEDLVAEGAQFDVVCALEIVEHVAEVGAFVSSLGKLVRPGGLLFLSTLNRTAKSYLMAIVGAEYVLRLLPRGTHDWKKFLRPSELAAHVHAAGLSLSDQCGMVLSPRGWTLDPRDLSVNYLQAAVKPAA